MKILDMILYTSLILCLSSDMSRVQPQEQGTSNAQVLSNQGLVPTWFGELLSRYQREQEIEEQLVTLDNQQEPQKLEETPSEQEGTDLVAKPVYVYGQPVPESERVSDSYFDDAAIVGDSRSQGLMAFGGLGGGDNLTGLGLSVYNLWDKAYVPGSTGEITVLKALETGEYSKVYIGLGINSVGYPSMEKFYSNYSALIDEVRLRQPQAVIYVQSIIPLNETVLAEKGSASHFTNQAVQEFNSYIQRIAQEKDLYYLDLYHFFLDENGELPREASGDGIHLTAEYTKIWAEYLKTHTVDPELVEVQSISQGEGENWEIYPDEGEIAAS